MNGAGRCVMAMGCLAVLAVVVGCGAGADKPPEGLSPEAQQGWRAYRTLGCAPCHGDRLEGKRSGPALTDIQDHWTHESLVTYLKDPPAMVKTTPRLAYKAEQYPIAMPAFGDKADDATLNDMAVYLLHE
jgi:cytochrome c2